MDKDIAAFLDENKTFSLAVSANNKPYCAILFYAFFKNNNSIIFCSKQETNHCRIAQNNSNVSATIIPTDLAIINLQGIQLLGCVKKLDNQTDKDKIKCYKLKFPLAVFSSAHLFWEVEIESIKMTNNKIGFGKKLYWERNTKISN